MSSFAFKTVFPTSVFARPTSAAVGVIDTLKRAVMAADPAGILDVVQRTVRDDVSYDIDPLVAVEKSSHVTPSGSAAETVTVFNPCNPLAIVHVAR